MSQCVWMLVDTWEEEFFDNLGQEDQGKEQDEAILSLEDIQLFLEAIYKMLYKWGILWTIYLLCR